MKKIDQKEQARRNLVMQVQAEGGEIESCLLEVDLTDIPESDIEAAEAEQMDLVGVFSIDYIPDWDWGKRDYRIPEPKIQFFVNIYPTGPGRFASQSFGSQEEAIDSAFDGAYRTAVKMIEE